VAGHQLLIIDELGFVPLSRTGTELLLEIFSQRYKRGATLVTSNLRFNEWPRYSAPNVLSEPCSIGLLTTSIFWK
jgi:DNA replication protein DnaC